MPKRVFFLTLIFVFMSLSSVSCGPSEEEVQATVVAAIAATQEAAPTAIPTNTPIPSPTPIPERFISYVEDFLSSASELNSATSQGINFIDFETHLNKILATYDIMEAAWPNDFAPVIRENFAQSVMGWRLTQTLWTLEIENLDRPVEPDINSYQLFLEYGKDDLNYSTYTDEYHITEYRGKQYIPFSNIEKLMGLASTYIETGREQFLTLIGGN